MISPLSKFPLTSILLAAGNQTVNYLSLDIEGAEIQVSLVKLVDLERLFKLLKHVKLVNLEKLLKPVIRVKLVWTPNVPQTVQMGSIRISFAQSGPTKII